MSVNINELTTKVGTSGFMSPNQYTVNIKPPNIAIKASVLTNFFTEAISPRIQRVNLPERALTTIQQRSSYRESINIPKGYSNFADLNMSIILSADMREKKLLMAWHDLIISPQRNFHPSYLDDIVGEITILTYGNKPGHTGSHDRKAPTGTEIGEEVQQHTFYDCYPLTVGDVDLSYTSNDEAATIDTTFTYRSSSMISGMVGERVAKTKTLGDVKDRPNAEAKSIERVLGGIPERNPNAYPGLFTPYFETAKSIDSDIRNKLKGVGISIPRLRR